VHLQRPVGYQDFDPINVADEDNWHTYFWHIPFRVIIPKKKREMDRWWWVYHCSLPLFYLSCGRLDWTARRDTTTDSLDLCADDWFAIQYSLHDIEKVCDKRHGFIKSKNVANNGKLYHFSTGYVESSRCCVVGNSSATSTGGGFSFNLQRCWWSNAGHFDEIWTAFGARNHVLAST